MRPVYRLFSDQTYFENYFELQKEDSLCSVVRIMASVAPPCGIQIF